MLNVPATISFVVITALIVGVTAIMAWRTHRKNKAHAKAKTKAEADDESYHIVYNTGRDDEDNGQEKRERISKDDRMGRWRWKRILQRVGWLRIPSSDDDGQEMRHMGRRGAVVEESVGEEVIVVYERSGTGPETETEIAAAAATTAAVKLPSPTDVPSFENLGGYRYGDFVYGPDNMSPLPVPVPVSVSASNSDRHHQQSAKQGITEVQGVSVASGSSSMPGSGKNSLESSRAAYRLTSYNGYPTRSQDDIMAALPIPKDHPLSQHHPMGYQHAVLPLPRQCARPSQDEEVHEIVGNLDEEGRNLYQEEAIAQGRNLQETNLQEEAHKTPIFQFERESLVPAPLNPRRGRHNPAARRRSNAHGSRAWAFPGQTKVVGQAGPLPGPSRPHSYCTSVSGSPATAGAGSRYSHFENPLRQHPVRGENGECPLSEVQARSGRHERVAPDVLSDQTEEEKGAVEPKLPVTGRRRMRYTYAFDTPLLPAEVRAPRQQDEEVQTRVGQFQGQDDDIRPCSVEAEGQGTKMPNETMVQPLFNAGNEFKVAFQISKNDRFPPIPIQFGARPVTSPPELLGRERSHPAEFARQHTAHPPALQIGRRPAALAQQNRHFSVFDGTWTTVPLSPVGRSPGKPVRWSRPAEEVKVGGKKRGYEE
jgi:hypothetical protein